MLAPFAVGVATLPLAWFVGWWAGAVDAAAFEVAAPSWWGVLGEAADWTGSVAAAAAVCAVAAVVSRRPGAVAAAAATGVIAYMAVALWLAPEAWLDWPGPWDPRCWGCPRGFGQADHANLATALSPALLALGAAAGALLAGRGPTGEPRPSPAAPAARILAAVPTILPALLVLGASIPWTADYWAFQDGWGMPSWDRLVAPAVVGAVLVVVSLGAPVRGPVTLPMMVGAALVVGFPHARLWSSGGPDTLLVAAFGPAVAVALAWAWLPLAWRVGAMLVPPLPPLPPSPPAPPSGGVAGPAGQAGGSVREGADPDL